MKRKIMTATIAATAVVALGCGEATTFVQDNGDKKQFVVIDDDGSVDSRVTENACTNAGLTYLGEVSFDNGDDHTGALVTCDTVAP